MDDPAWARRTLAQRDKIVRRQKAPTARKIAYDYIRGEILSGRMSPRSRLAQDEIADELAISRIPIREALVSLEAEGLILHRPNRGVYVKPITRPDVMSAYELRGYALGMAARRAIETDVGLDQLVAELECNLQKLHAERDSASLLALSTSFDALVAEAGASPHLRLYLERSLGYEPDDVYAWAPQLVPLALRAFDARLQALRNRDRGSAVTTSLHHALEYGDCLANELVRRGILIEPGVSSEVT